MCINGSALFTDHDDVAMMGSMCGRFVFTDPSRIKSLMPEATIDEQVIMEFRPSYNIAPSQNVLAMINDQTRALTLTRWGLIPAWSKAMSTGYTLINARVESLHDKPMFRALVHKQRCLIFADGFYEWKREAGRKHPYFIRRQDLKPMALAGLWDTWKTQDTAIISSTIITTKANAQLASIHDRMPVILPLDCYPTWLDPCPLSPESIKSCLNAESSVGLEAYAVTALVNNPKNSGPDCIQPHRSPH